MQNAEELFYRSVQLNLRAERAVGEAKAGLQREHVEMLHRMVEVDPHFVEAQNNLGHMYEKGKGVEKDAVQAVHWFRKAAEQGGAQAQYNLGVMYLNGEGVKKDAVQAVRWFRKAVEHGDANAQAHLGFMYGEGEGVKKDAVQAVRWHRKAAEQGHAVAQYNLGCRYGNGIGVQQSLSEAARWWRMAADQGDVHAHCCLGQLTEQQGEYQAAIAHYRAGQAALGPEEACACIRRCVGAVVRAKQEEQNEQEERNGE
jgi:TPR repeat protein